MCSSIYKSCAFCNIYTGIRHPRSNLHAVNAMFDKTLIDFALVILPTMVSMVLALSVLVLIVVSDAVLEPMTTTFGTVRQLRLPPADLKLNRRIADDRRSLSRPPPPSAPCCPRDGCDCDVSPVSHALLPKLPHLVADSRFLEHPCNSSDYGFARVPRRPSPVTQISVAVIRRNSIIRRYTKERFEGKSLVFLHRDSLY